MTNPVIVYLHLISLVAPVGLRELDEDGAKLKR